MNNLNNPNNLGLARKNGGRRRGSRRSGSRRGLFQTLYGPISQALGLTGNVVSTVTNTTRNVAKKGLHGVDSVGLAVTGRANAAIRGLISRKNRKNRRGGRRNSRRNSRRNRNSRNSRNSRR